MGASPRGFEPHRLHLFAQAKVVASWCLLHPCILLHWATCRSSASNPNKLWVLDARPGSTIACSSHRVHDVAPCLSERSLCKTSASHRSTLECLRCTCVPISRSLHD